MAQNSYADGTWGRLFSDMMRYPVMTYLPLAFDLFLQRHDL